MRLRPFIMAKGFTKSPSATISFQAASVSSVSWDEAYDTDSYPMGRSLEQVMEHCESILDKLDDPNYGEPISVLDAEIEKMIAEWK